ncbi:MAG: hypothetical protein K6G26_03115, partial [Lachnospiraceae bacterium]|nr:hypothetical protein [Lachnospiraceae bacterium]
ITYITHNGFGYKFSYDEKNNMTGVWADTTKLITSAYETVVVPKEEVEKIVEEAKEAASTESTSTDNKATEEVKDEETSVLKSQKYGNGDTYDYTYSEDGMDLLTIKINGTVAFEMSYTDHKHNVYVIRNL